MDEHPRMNSSSSWKVGASGRLVPHYFNINMHSNAHTHPIFFLSPGNLSLEKSKRKKLCDWLPDQGWEDIVRLMELFPNEFGSLADDIEKNPEEWKTVSGRNHQTHTR